MERFYKLSGAGNDFIALVEPDSVPGPRQIAARCRRGISEGADGLFVLERLQDGVGMRYFNSDGKAAALCINGTRCAARLAFELGWAEDRVAVATDAGVFVGYRASEHEIEIEVVAPTAEVTPLSPRVGRETFSGWQIQVGVPHFVVPWEADISTAPVATAGPELRRHPDFGPAGANIDFVRFVDPHRFEVRSFERGVEAETLACGTGVLATAAVGRTIERCELPVAAVTRGGFVIHLAHDDHSDRWRMRGDARLVAVGELAPGADHSPAVPDW